MTLVVADTGPINYLILVGAISALSKLHDRVFLPSAVVAELKSPLAPSAVRAWATNLPDWVEVAATTLKPSISQFGIELHRGEWAALSLAVEIKADRVLLDDLDAREVAVKSGLKITGTIRILEEASSRGLIDLRTAFETLRKTNFRVSEGIIKQALARDAARCE
jgi:predicted nucleic acid-binding protein